MKLKIFLVEDNADTRFMLTFLLEQAGHEVRPVGTMKEALHELARGRWDVLLSDLGLPDGDGCDLMRRLGPQETRPFGIAMSGFGAAADVAESLEAGFRHHLVKPVEATLLERLIQEAADEIGATP